MIETTYALKAPARIALAADLHNADPADALRSLAARRPALIAVAGDLALGHNALGAPLDRALPNLLPFVRGCAAIAPTFFSLGNHEWILRDEDLRAIADAGATVLDNAWTAIDIGGHRIVVGGLTSAHVTANRRLGVGNSPARLHGAPDTVWLDVFERQEGYKLLLCHHPEYWPKYLKGRKIDLALAGHAHGGQWRFFGRGLYAPGQGLLPRLTAGVYGRLVVSRGLANATCVPRINNPTEIVYIE